MLNEGQIADIVALQDYENLVRGVCRQAVRSPNTTYLLMERYTYINGFAGSGVALLAGNIGYSRELFRDKSIQPEASSDRGMLIAPKVLSATVDEHSDRLLGQASHRSLALACLNAVADYAVLSSAERSLLDLKPKRFLQLVEQFKNNYRSEAGNAASLVRSMGYHIASEYLADREYQIKDEEVWFKHPDERFRNTVKRERKDGAWHGPWAWVTTHGHFGEAEGDTGHGVEHDHFSDALHAFETVVRFRPDDLTEEDMLSLATEGLQLFRSNWTEFYTVVSGEIQGSLKR